MAQYRLAVFDLDNTLLDRRRQLSLRTRASLKRLSDFGVRLAFATARPPRDVRPLLRGIDFPLGPCIYYNGALVYDHTNDRVLRSVYLAPGLVRDLFDAFHAEGVDNLLAECGDSFWVQQIDDDVENWIRSGGLPPRTVGLAAYPYLEEPIAKLVVRGDHVRLLPRLQARFGDRLTTTFSDPRETWLELTAPGASKETAVTWLAAYYGVALKEVVAFGDSDNDSGMLRAAGLGVAVGNATDAVKCAADRIAPPYDEDGVATVLDDLFPYYYTEGGEQNLEARPHALLREI
jgi:Cof subfamily protein (haloacid dehalogenase superfamily)